MELVLWITIVLIKTHRVRRGESTGRELPLRSYQINKTDYVKQQENCILKTKKSVNFTGFFVFIRTFVLEVLFCWERDKE